MNCIIIANVLSKALETFGLVNKDKILARSINTYDLEITLEFSSHDCPGLVE